MGVEGGEEVGNFGLAQRDKLGPVSYDRRKASRRSGVSGRNWVALATYTRRQAGLHLPLKTVRTEAQQ